MCARVHPAAFHPTDSTTVAITRRLNQLRRFVEAQRRKRFLGPTAKGLAQLRSIDVCQPNLYLLLSNQHRKGIAVVNRNHATIVGK